MARYFIEISFKGTNYHGWQIQPNGDSIQARINNALSLILRENIETTGAGRTDAGVHASFFIAHFDSENDTLHCDKNFLYHAGSILPFDIALNGIYRVNDDMHSRFDAVSRTYTYQLITKKDPFIHDLAYLNSKPPDIEIMNRLAEIMKGYNDFSCFCKTETDVKTKICNITHAQWTKKEHIYTFTIKANRFLRNMVRAVVGTLLEAGYGKLNQEDFIAILESKDRNKAGWSVPAQGLCLTEILYPYDNNNLMGDG